MERQTTTDIVCSGSCVPLYLYGAIAGVGIAATHYYSEFPTFGDRMGNLLTSLFWAISFGFLVFLLCRACKPVYAYMALIPPSFMFGVQMLTLLMQNDKRQRKEAVKK